MSKFIKAIKCTKCKGNIQLDCENLISYCPYCGTALMIDVSTIQEILIEKEKTKQVESREREKTKQVESRERHKFKSKLSEGLIDLIALILVLGFFVFLFYGVWKFAGM